MRFVARILPVLLTLVSASSAADAADGKPNVLFLFADDQRADAIAALGNPAIQTPTLDRLVNSGFVFRNAYCLGANVGAVCSPSRNMLLSGRTYFRWEGRDAPADGLNFPVSMKRAGYETYHHGKKGNTALKIQEKFDHNKYLNDQQDRTCGEPGKRIVDEAIAFLESRDGSRPFFMYLAFANPHDPRVAAPRYMDLYQRDAIPLPKNYLPLHPFDNGEQLVRDERLAPWPRTEAEIRKHLHDYYATITALDGHIGRLIERLRALGQYDNTIIIYSADHGLALGSHGLMGKQSLYEHSMKAPLIFAGPGIRQGSTDALVYLMDIYPTVAGLVGAPLPDNLDGKGLTGVLSDPSSSPRATLGLSYRDVQRAIRDERYKLIRYPQINKTQLFDLQKDPNEMHNLADEPGQAERIAGLMASLESWQREVGDTCPLTSDNPRDARFVPPADEAPARPKRAAKNKQR
jgi:arylsulfatase A-like enzyme